MTTLSTPLDTPTDRPHPREVRTAVFGVWVRRQAIAQAIHVTVVATTLVGIAVTLDLSQWLGRLMRTAFADGGGGIPWILRYVALRIPDLLARLLPIASFLGVLWSEVADIRARRRIVTWTTGRSTLQALVPLTVVGLGAGLLQWTLETHVRPWVVAIQIEERLGEFGERFDRGQKAWSDWFVAGHDVARARIDRTGGLTLADLLVVRSDDDGRVDRVVIARSARLAADDLWDLDTGVEIALDGDRRRGKGDRLKTHTFELPIARPLERTTLAVDPTWLVHLGINAKYLPQAALEALAAPPRPTYPPDEYRTWRHARIADALLPFAMALIAAALSFVLIPYEVTAVGVFTIAAAGYVGHVAIRALLSLGEKGALPPVVAAWATPVLLVAVSTVVVARQALEIRRTLSAAAPPHHPTDGDAAP